MSTDGFPGPVAQWPPEVPPFRPPIEPPDRPLPRAPEPAAPPPILPTWEEYEPSLRDRDLVDRLLERRVVTVTGHLDDELANRVAAQLLILGRSHQPVELHLSCAESDLGASLGLAGAVDLMRGPVNAIVRGTLRGPVVAVLCACERRAAHRHTLFVLSLPASPVRGGATEVAGLAEQHRHQVAQLRARIAEVTGQDKAVVARDLEDGRVLTAEEAKDYGLVADLL